MSTTISRRFRKRPMRLLLLIDQSLDVGKVLANSDGVGLTVPARTLS